MLTIFNEYVPGKGDVNYPPEYASSTALTHKEYETTPINELLARLEGTAVLNGRWLYSTYYENGWKRSTPLEGNERTLHAYNTGFGDIYLMASTVNPIYYPPAPVQVVRITVS